MRVLVFLGSISRNNYNYNALFALRKIAKKMDVVFIKAGFAAYPELNNIFDDKYYFGRVNWFKDADWRIDDNERKKIENEINEIESKTGISIYRIIYSERGMHGGWAKFSYWKYPTKIHRYTAKNKENAKIMFLRVFKYYKQIIEKTSPDVVFSTGVGSVTNYLPAVYCKYKDIPFLHIYPSTVIYDRVFFSDNVFGYNTLAQQEYVEDLSKSVKGDLVSLTQYINSMEEYSLSSRYNYFKNNRTEAMKPSFLLTKMFLRYAHMVLNCARKVYKSKRVFYWHTLYEKNLFLNIISWYLYGELASSRLKIFKIYSPDELSKMNYIYFPLHWEPENSLYINAPAFGNQLFAVELISKFIPLNMKLFIRDHYANVGMRTGIFYKYLKNIPSVELISPTISPFPILKNASLVITINGTSGWQALCMKKPVITLGNTFYDILGLTYKIKDIHNIDKELIDILKNHKIANEEEYFNRLALYRDAEKNNSFNIKNRDDDEIISLFMKIYQNNKSQTINERKK